MFEIRAGNSLIYSPILSQKGYVLNSIKLTEEVNKAASLTFTVPNINENIGVLTALKPEVKVYRDGQRIFRGRVVSYARDFWQTREVKCEGELAYLRDAVVRPETYQNKTPAQYFKHIIEDVFNPRVDAYKQFHVDLNYVTVTGTAKDWSTDQYPDVLSELTDKLLNEYGGAFRVRCVVENGAEVNYIDYLADAGGTGGTGDSTEGSQSIRFAKNLLDMVAEQDATPTFTAIVPLGALDNKVRLTIGTPDYLEDATAVASFGRIEVVKTYDTIKTAGELEAAGQADLNKAVSVSTSLEVKAVDLSIVGEASEPLIVGKKYHVVAPPNAPTISELVRLNRAESDLLSPDKSVYTFGTVGEGITHESVAVRKAASAIAQVALLAQDQATKLEETVGQLKTKVDAITDYITAHNSENGWSWDTYHSGRVDLHGAGISVTWGAWTAVDSMYVSTGTVTLPLTLAGSYAVMCSGSDVFLAVAAKTGSSITLTAYSTGQPTTSTVDLYIVK